MDNNTITLIMFAVLAVFIFLTWRNGRKRKAALEEAKTQYVPGAEIMTNSGIYGKIKSLEGDVLELEIAPKTVVRMHAGAIMKVVTADDSDAPKSVEEAMARAKAEEAAREAELNVDHAIPLGEPEFGERDPQVKKPARRSPAKKTAE